eukprot:Gb_31489 [translate_table: standard]
MAALNYNWNVSFAPNTPSCLSYSSLKKIQRFRFFYPIVNSPRSPGSLPRPTNVKCLIPLRTNTWRPDLAHQIFGKAPILAQRNTWRPISSSYSTHNCSFESSFRGISDLIPFDINVLPLSRTYIFIKPFVEGQWIIILKAWLCTLIAVGCLFVAVPWVGELSSLLAAGDIDNLSKKALFALAVVFSRSVAQYFQQALLWEAALNVTYEIRSHVFLRVLNRDMCSFECAEGTVAGDIAYRITAEAEDTADTVYALLHTLVPCTLQLTAMAARMFFLSPILSVATISVIPFMSLAIAYLGEKLRHISRKGQDSIARLSSYLNEVLLSMLIIKAHNAEDCEHWRFQKLAQADRKAHLSKKKLKAFIPEVITIVYAGTTLVLFWAGSWVISHGTFNGAGMVSFVTSLVLLIEPIQALGKAYNELKQGEPAIERLFELTMFCPQVVDKDDSIPLSSIAGDVKFCNVTFQYGDAQPLVLSNLNLHVKAGETVALVGPSGGGKTTIAKLLLRLYDPIEGRILVDDHDIRNICLKSLRRHIALVPQDIVDFEVVGIQPPPQLFG